MSLNKKILLGLALIIGNFVVGKLALLLIAISVELGLAVYLVSWLMLIVGLVLCGHQGLAWARTYYHHFEEKIAEYLLERFRSRASKIHPIDTPKPHPHEKINYSPDLSSHPAKEDGVALSHRHESVKFILRSR